MPASLRIEIFPTNIHHTITFYTHLLNFTLPGHSNEDTYAYLQRDTIFIGADASHPTDSLPVDTKFRRPPTGVEVVIEVDHVQAERDRFVQRCGEIDADLKVQEWGLRDFRVVDPDGYYLRITERSGRGDGMGF